MSGVVPQVRASILQEYHSVARFVGVDPERMLRERNIRVGNVLDPANRIAASAAVQLYEDTAKLSGREDFGLLMAECRSFAALGPVGLLMRYQPTIRDALTQVIGRMKSLNDLLPAFLDEHEDTALIRFEIAAGFDSRQIVEAGVAIACRVYRELSAGRWQPDKIHFRHAAPANPATHRRVFACPIRFESDFDGIVCSARRLDAANPLGDPAMADLIEGMIAAGAVAPPATVTEQARQAIFMLIGSGNATKDNVAATLAIHPRALQRHLSRENTNFGDLLNESKRKLAMRYLSGARHSVTDVAVLLGYSTVSSFTRWFTEEFGMSPAAWRKQAQPRDIFAAMTTASAA